MHVHQPTVFSGTRNTRNYVPYGRRTAMVVTAIAWLALVAAREATAGTNPYLEVQLPVPQGAYSVRTVIADADRAVQTAYKIRSRYPADNLTGFYQSELQKAGWVPSTDTEKGVGWGAGEWTEYADLTLPGNPSVRIWGFSGVREDIPAEIRVVIRYVSAAGNWGDEAEVVCRIGPIINVKQLYEDWKRAREREPDPGEKKEHQ